ncbi:MAG: SusC/RagA family TonB-linked outer membrane protein [Tannerella sp.]|nr:SusC/RagA family TonB-linked outer membrane protein [Tannerella sp.]
MRVAIILLFVFIFQAGAENLYSQSARVSLDMRNATVEEVLNTIEEESEFYFLYNSKLVNVDRKVNVKVKSQPVETVLDRLFASTDVIYKVEDRQIILSSKEFATKERLQNSKKIKGVIVDEQGDPVVGASIIVPGTTNGIISDANGEFTIETPQNAELQISYIGYLTQTVSTANQTDLHIVMVEDTQVLDEVVVIGYGTMRKKDLTGSVVQIRPDKIANENPKTVQDILRGTPGLKVGYSASAKGGGDMEIRGRRSVYDQGQHNSPLLILDGMIFYGELSEVNPDDIGQIDILKDASAAAIYGAKAASGVIIITTKKGKQGKPVINVTTNVGWTQASTYRKRFGTEDYLQHRQDWYTKNTYGVNSETGAYEAYQTGVYANQPGFFMRPDQLPGNVSVDAWRGYTMNADGESDLSIWAKRLGFQGRPLENLLAGRTVDWADHTYRTGFNQDYNAGISGAGEKVNYYLSIGYLKDQGAKISDEYEAIRANMKINATVNKWLEVGANINFQDRSDGEIGINIDESLRNSPYADYADEAGNPVQYPLSSEYSQRGINYGFQKQYLELEKGYTVLNSILNAKVTLPFNITYTFNASPRYQFFYDRYFMSADLPGSDPKSRGANREQTRQFDWSLNNTVNWDCIFDHKHHVILTLVQEAEERQSWKDRIEARNILPSDALGFHNTKNGSKENSTYSSEDSHQTADALLARLFYSYDNRYMLTTSIRRDGYSAFGSSNPYATFPSVAVAWSFADEKFFEWNHIMNTGKLRISYGKNGNRSLDNPYVALANLYEGGGKMHGYINSSGQLELLRYLYMDRLANPNLQWEKTASWNFGLDFGFLNDRISGTLEYYEMKTHDMIMNQRLPSFTGFTNITTNLGQVDNKGIELSLNSLNINHKNLQWTTTLGFSYNKNQITHLYYEYENVLDANGNVTGTKEMDDIPNKWFIGQSIGAIWDYRVTGIWQANEVEEAAKYGQQPGDPKVANSYTADDGVNADGSVKPVYNDNDKEFLGQEEPPVHWSLRNEFILWKNFSFSFNIYSKMGHKSLRNYYLNNDDDGGRMAYALANVPKKDYWTPDNPTDKHARIEAKGPVGAESASKLYDRSFIRLENISAGYTLPKRWTVKWDIESVKIYGSIRNVAVWAKDWEYGDPETDPALSEGGGLAVRTFSLGLNLTF